MPITSSVLECISQDLLLHIFKSQKVRLSKGGLGSGQSRAKLVGSVEGLLRNHSRGGKVQSQDRNSRWRGVCIAEMQDAGLSKVASEGVSLEVSTPPSKPQTLEQWDQALSLKLYKDVGSHLPRSAFMLLEHSGSGAIWLPLVPLIWMAPQLSVQVSCPSAHA
jgi:hypothetical protein